jgi:GMP synthase-like glutamine amidotransferase
LNSVVITGSTLSVTDLSPEMKEAIDTLRKAYDHSESLKILGICYGHQLTLHNFGAKVVHKGMIARVESITFENNILEKYPYLIPLAEMSPLSISQYHEDQV